MNNIQYVGLDISKWSTGVAILTGNSLDTFVIQGDKKKKIPVHPKLQLDKILDNISTQIIHVQIGYERHTHFRGATVAETLIEINGYIKYSLEAIGYEVLPINVNSYRASNGIKGKDKKQQWQNLINTHFGVNLTTDHCDAIGIALHMANMNLEDIEEFIYS